MISVRWLNMRVLLTLILGGLAALSCALTLWQWVLARRFPMHERVGASSFTPATTVLKPLKGLDEFTERCLRSWFEQQYTGELQILFGVASAEDPVCSVVRKLIEEYKSVDAELVICTEQLGANAKVSTLIHLQRCARHDLLVISDADVRGPQDLLSNLVASFQDPGTGLVNCFYCLANPVTAAMRWEAVAINADFWGQVLQARSLKPLDFALGAVMATTRQQLEDIGGFARLVECLADDYQLGHQIALRGKRIVLCPVVVECWSAPMTWRQVWEHQLRWARTIRVCQPLPFFFSILSNATLWPLVWLAAEPALITAAAFGLFAFARILIARSNYQRLTGSKMVWSDAWLVAAKDLLGVAIWALAFAGNQVEWRGENYLVLRDGSLRQAKSNNARSIL
jgi:ceramide glucosyltransferase